MIRGKETIGNNKKDKKLSKKDIEIKNLKKQLKQLEKVKEEVEEDKEEVEEVEEEDDKNKTEFEETTEGIVEVDEDKNENKDKDKDEDEKIEVCVEDLDEIREDFHTIVKSVSDELHELSTIVEEKNEIIDVLSRKNIDLINIDMEIISNELHKSEVKLNAIATIKQFERLNELEATNGMAMAYKVSKLYLEHAGMEARLTVPTLNLIKISLEKISEKLKYVAED